MRELAEFTDAELDTLIANYRGKGATGLPFYARAMEEWHDRKGGVLQLAKTIRFLHEAAEERRFVSYGQIAEANGCTWNAVRYPMNSHLWALVDLAKRCGWPMLSAMVVNKTNLESGAMDEATLQGFITAAKALNLLIADEARFREEQQQACFAWGQQPLVLPSYLE